MLVRAVDIERAGLGAGVETAVDDGGLNGSGWF
jgi:hypothetical protein